MYSYFTHQFFNSCDYLEKRKIMCEYYGYSFKKKIVWLLAVAWVFGSVFVTGHVVLLKLRCVCKCVVIGTLSEMNILSREI